jgi:hypothetical protein
MACAAVSAQIPAGWNYNPFLYYPFTAQPAPVQEMAKVVAARAARAARPPVPLTWQPTLPPEDPAEWSPFNLFLLLGDNRQVPCLLRIIIKIQFSN